MAYSTPELFLVGAAQNLVLGTLTPKNQDHNEPEFGMQYKDGDEDTW